MEVLLMEMSGNNVQLCCNLSDHIREWGVRKVAFSTTTCFDRSVKKGILKWSQRHLVDEIWLKSLLLH